MERTAEKFGILIAIGLIIFFLIMIVVGWGHVLELRVLNFGILAIGVVKACKTQRAKSREEFTYFKGLGMGMLTSIIASLVFALFVFIYVSFLDPDFMQAIIEKEPMGRFLNPYIVSVTIATEGIASGLIVSFITMNYLDVSPVN